MANSHDVFFFIRAYNDLDIQMSLIKAFAEDPAFNVRVIFYPSDGFISHPDMHESTAYIQEHFNVRFQSILELEECPLWLKTLHNIQKTISGWRLSGPAISIAPLGFLLKISDVGIRKLMQPALSQKAPQWMRDMASKWNPSIIFSDEILFQPGRSPLIDDIIPALIEKGAAAYTILTGHRVYTAVNPTGEKTENTYRPSKAQRYFVPSAHNKKIYTVLFPQENITVGGNLRFDRAWVNFIHDKILPAPAQLPDAPVKIVLMLSKMSYGVEADLMKETIRRLGRMPGVALAIKPHTRGMRFDFMGRDEIGHAIIADKTPSSTLVEWADLTLMTGSSIVFHTMLRGKIAGFLKYCQTLETIFEDGKSCEVYESLDDLISYVENAVKNGMPAPPESLEKFIAHEIHGDVKDGLTAKHYKSTILEDLNKNSQSPETGKTAQAAR